jgi:integrase
LVAQDAQKIRHARFQIVTYSHSLQALGLHWSDIDLDAGTLRVNRQLQRLRRDGDVAGKLVFSEPKNASRRTINLPQRAPEASDGGTA